MAGESRDLDKSGVTAPVTVGEGGTGATTPQDSRAALGNMSTNNYSGGVISGFLTSTFSYTAGVGYIVTGYNPEPVTVKVEYDAGSTITPSFQSTNLFIDSAGDLVQRDADASVLSAEDLRDEIFLGTVAFIGVIIGISATPSISVGVNGRLELFLHCLGGITCSGNVISANGANLDIDRSAGLTHRIASNFVNDPSIPDLTTDPIDVDITDPGNSSKAVIAYQSASPPGFTFESFTAGITPNDWDDGSGLKASVSVGKWTIFRVYFFNATNTYIIQLGQTEYNMMADAQVGIKGEQFVRSPNVLDDANLLASIVVKQAETSLESGDTVIQPANKFGEP